MGPWGSPLQEKGYYIVRFEVSESLPTTSLCLLIYAIVAVGDELAMNIRELDEDLDEKFSSASGANFLKITLRTSVENARF
jgi:hypothetical protein